MDHVNIARQTGADVVTVTYTRSTKLWDVWLRFGASPIRATDTSVAVALTEAVQQAKRRGLMKPELSSDPTEADE